MGIIEAGFMRPPTVWALRSLLMDTLAILDISLPASPMLSFRSRIAARGVSSLTAVRPVGLSLTPDPLPMSTNSLDINELAAYLHLTPQQVQRMADRGRIPGRKVGGQWRFNEAEIHAWLEERIGASEDMDQLDRMQAVVDRWSGSSEQPPGISQLLLPDAVEVPLNARTHGSVIRRMCSLAERTGLLWDVQRMAQAVAAREELASTALDSGVALLHPRRPQPSILGGPLLALGVTAQPIPFGNLHGNLTDVFFLICSTDDRVHLQVLTKLSRMLSGTDLLDQLRQSPDAKSAWQAVQRNEVQMDQHG